MNATELTPELTKLLDFARTLPSDQVREVTDFAEFLGRKRLIPTEPVEYEDWNEEDLRQLRIASMRRFEEEHGEENWGVDYEAMLKEKPCSPQET